ncbi:hypothetical protein [Desulfobacca acetoxidans]
MVEEVLCEVMKNYQPSQAMPVPLHEFFNTLAPPAGIILLSEMGKFIENRTRGFLPFTKQYSQRYLNDRELRLIDSLLDDRVLNDLLACPGYTPSMRQISPAHSFRAELLKALRYADMSPNPTNVFGLRFAPNAEKYPSILGNPANFRISSRKSTRSASFASIWKDRTICSSMALA